MSDEQKTLEPKRGAIARCSLGLLGMITTDEPEEVVYSDGNKGLAWKGIQLQAKDFEGIKGDKGKKKHVEPGDPWSSREPKVLCESFDELVTNAFSYDIILIQGSAYIELKSKFATMVVPLAFLQQIVGDVEAARQAHMRENE